MKTAKVETPKLPAQRGSRRWLIRLGLLLGVPFLFYYGYCWGLWGRHSLLLQYLFQCNCPPASEEWRYPDNVDVIVPACKYLDSVHSPSGRLLYVLTEESGTTSTYLLDLESNEKTSFALPEESSNYFLTDDLIFNAYYRGGEYVFDRTNNLKYPILRFGNGRPEAYTDGNLNLSLLVDELRGAKDIFLIDDDSIVVFVEDFPSQPELNFMILRSNFPGREANRIEQFLQQNSIEYHRIPDRYPGELISPDGKFIARADGIYLTATEQRIVEGYSVSRSFYGRKNFSVRGWAYDSGRAFYTTSGACLIVVIFPPFEIPGCFIEIPQPLLLLKVPEEYLVSTEKP